MIHVTLPTTVTLTVNSAAWTVSISGLHHIGKAY